MTTPKIGDTQVTDTKLANDAVTTRAIKDGEITRPKIAPANITDVELSLTGTSTGQFTAADITVNDQGRITAAANGTIGTTEIENGAVTLDKINSTAQVNQKAVKVNILGIFQYKFTGNPPILCVDSRPELRDISTETDKDFSIP